MLIKGGWHESFIRYEKYISDNYSALAAGENTYISVKDDNIAPLLSQINSLGLTSKDLVEKMYDSGLLTENLAVAIAAAERAKAILEFEREISNSHPESYWQDWFTRQKWILGSEYLKTFISSSQQIVDNRIYSHPSGNSKSISSAISLTSFPTFS